VDASTLSTGGSVEFSCCGPASMEDTPSHGVVLPNVCESRERASTTSNGERSGGYESQRDLTVVQLLHEISQAP
jgi:hypothetical protein